jgi:ubiquinone biosynthesis accessory factor UbiJ
MLANATNALAAKAINRILAQTPLAQERLRAHAGKRLAVRVGPLNIELTMAEDGRSEPSSTASSSNAAPDVAFQIPLNAIPRLVRKDESAYREVKFEGDSEFAHTLSSLARELDWDIEEELAALLRRAVGDSATADIIAHRVGGSVNALRSFRDEAGTRFTENLYEYLVHEKNAFVTKDDLESLARDNETLRDDIARMEARLAIVLAR